MVEAPWWQAPPILEQWGACIVAREDLAPGGSKIRFLPHLVGDAKEIVYGGPFCGGAPYAMSVWGKRAGCKVTLFYAKRSALHWRQQAAFRNGAQLFQVPAGRMSVVQHRARTYAADHGAKFLPLGFDVPEATDPFVAHMRKVRETVGAVDEVWCATGSGMLARCLGRAFPDATVHGVVVGLRSRNRAQEMPANVELQDAPYDFAEPCAFDVPFPCDRNYDAKAYEAMVKDSYAHPSSTRRLFWNVLGDAPQVDAC